MKKVWLMVGLVLVVFACSEPVSQMLKDGGQAMMDAGNGMLPDAGAETPGDGASMKFVGVSSGTAVPMNGLFGLYAACQSTYGTNHRMCTQAEIMNTANMPTMPEGPSLYAGSLTSTPCDGYRIDRQSGTNTYLYVPTMNELAQFSTNGGSCSVEIHVACCGPR